MRAPLPSKLGPCRKFDICPGSKFCAICGHTSGKHTGEVSEARKDAEDRTAARRNEYK